MPIKTILRDEIALKEYITAYVCNSCGKTFDAKESLGGYHVIRLSGGYGDRFPGDMETLEMVVCDGCLKAWVDTFKYPDVFLEDRVGTVCTHTETGERFKVLGFLVHPEDMPPHEVDALYKRVAAAAELDRMEHELPEIKPGVWEHFKGGRYFVDEDPICLTPDMTPHVLYRELYGESRYWIRPLDKWLEKVDIDGQQKSRFRWIAPAHV